MTMAATATVAIRGSTSFFTEFLLPGGYDTTQAPGRARKAQTLATAR